MSGSLENSSFPRKQPVASFWSNAHAWVGGLSFEFLGKDEKHAKGLGEWLFCSERKEKESGNEKLSYLGSKLNFIINFM